MLWNLLSGGAMLDLLVPGNGSALDLGGGRLGVDGTLIASESWRECW